METVAATEKKKKNKNLYRFTPENASYYGHKGGSVKSDRKKITSTIRAIKHGKYTKNKTVMKAITPTPFEKAVGITKDDKIKYLKQIAPTLASGEVGEALTNYGMTLASIKSKLMVLEQLYNEAAETNKDKIVALKSILWWENKYAEKEWEFVTQVFGVGKPNFSITSETETTELTLTKIMERVLGEIK